MTIVNAHISRDSLVAGLKKAVGIIPAHPAIDPIAYVLLDVDPVNITLTTNNIEVQRVISLKPTCTMGSWKLLIPGKRLLDYLLKVGEPDLELKLEAGFRLSLRHGSKEVIFNGLDPAQFPALPQMTPFNVTIQTSGSQFKRAVRQVIFACPESSISQPVLTAVRLVVKQDAIVLTATDQKTIAQSKADAINANTGEFLINGGHLASFVKALDSEQLDISFNDSLICLKSAEFAQYCLGYVEKYPVQAAFFRMQMQTEFEVPRELLLNSLERIIPVISGTQENCFAVKGETDGTNLTLEGVYRGNGEIKEQVPVSCSGAGVFSFNLDARCMIEILKSLQGVSVGLKIGDSACLVIDPNTNEARYLANLRRDSNVQEKKVHSA
jgi:DNA polymerase-3 subunit beta